MDTSNPLLKRNIAMGSAASSGTMDMEGVVNKTGILLLLCMVAGIYSWAHADAAGPLVMIGCLGGLVCCLIGAFVPTTVPFTAPLYAVLEGLALGAISELLNARYHGIVLNAVMLTTAVLALMLFLYATRIIRVTNSLVAGVCIATGAVCLIYVVDFILGFFGISLPMLNSSGPVGIGISLVIVGIAAFNLLLDFAAIEGGIRNNTPKYMEWYYGMALMVTLVWLYLELLRLMGKLQRR